jgi:fatty acid desaturase
MSEYLQLGAHFAAPKVAGAAAGAWVAAGATGAAGWAGAGVAAGAQPAAASRMASTAIALIKFVILICILLIHFQFSWFFGEAFSRDRMLHPLSNKIQINALKVHDLFCGNG